MKMTRVDNTLIGISGRVHEALAVHGITAPDQAIEDAAMAIMTAEDDWYWSAVILDNATAHDLRMIAVARRREAIDRAMEPLFARQKG